MRSEHYTPKPFARLLTNCAAKIILWTFQLHPFSLTSSLLTLYTITKNKPQHIFSLISGSCRSQRLTPGGTVEP